MPIAIGSPAFSSATCSSGASIACLEAQLARHQKALSEQVNCSSAKTPEGKAAIADLSNKIGTVKTRIEEIANAQSSAPSATLKTAEVSTNNEAVTAPRSANSSVGSQLDVLA